MGPSGGDHREAPERFQCLFRCTLFWASRMLPRHGSRDEQTSLAPRLRSGAGAAVEGIGPDRRQQLARRAISQFLAMNPVLAEILRSHQVQDSTGARRPLRFHMNAAEGEVIDRVIRSVKPDTSLEIGFAYGISTLFACDALERNKKPCRHIVV